MDKEIFDLLASAEGMIAGAIIKAENERALIQKEKLDKIKIICTQLEEIINVQD